MGNNVRYRMQNIGCRRHDVTMCYKGYRMYDINTGYRRLNVRYRMQNTGWMQETECVIKDTVCMV